MSFVDADIVLPEFLCENTRQHPETGLRAAVCRTFRESPVAHAGTNRDDLSAAPLLHGRNCRPGAIVRAKQIGANGFLPGRRIAILNGVVIKIHPCIQHCDVDSAEFGFRKNRKALVPQAIALCRFGMRPRFHPPLESDVPFPRFRFLSEPRNRSMRPPGRNPAR